MSNKTLIKKVLIPLLMLIIGAVTSSYTTSQNKQSPSTLQVAPTGQVQGATATNQFAKVVQVIDGDTFKIETGEHVRLVGMDTPELHHPSKPVQCFGKEAMLKTKELIEGKTVRLEKDVSEKDRYGRLLRFVYFANLSPTPLPAGQTAEIFLNAYLVQEGFAHAATFPPDVSKADLFRQLEREAAINHKGLWQMCN